MKRAPSLSMPKEWSATNQAGFSLVEVILSSAVFVLLVTALVGAYLYGQEATALAGNRARAVMFAEEGLEAVRNIRDPAFANLTNGTYGLATTSNQWNFSGSSDVNGMFTRQVTIGTVTANEKQMSSSVSWTQNAQRAGSVTLTTYLTNWIGPANGGAPPTTCAAYCQSLPAGYTDGTCRKGVPQCNANGETSEHGGNNLCTQADGGTCCCLP